MTELFYTILNMSISASILILVVLLLRLLFRKAPKWVTVLLWGLVAVRLICPFAVESPFSLMPKSEWITEKPAYNEENQYFDSVPLDRITVDSEIGNDINVHYYTVPVEPHIEIHRGVNPVFVLNGIWIAGIAAMLVYMLISYICVYRRIRGAEQFKDNIYTSEAVSSPFVFGLIRTRIYLPENMDAISMSYVIAHEEAHLRRLDHLWKPLGFLLLAVHWFNPLIWIGYVLLCRDIEMACDERVVRGMNEDERVDYSEALLDCSVNRKMITACPLAFGEVGAKQRIKSVLNYRKPAFWIIAVAVIACIVAAVCFLTDPQSEADAPDGSYTLEIYFDLDYELTAPLKESNDVKVVIDDLMNVWVYDGKELMSGGLYKEIKLNAQNFDALFENTAVDIGLVMDLRKDIRSSWVMTYTTSENGHHPYLIIVDDNDQVYLVVADYISGTPKSISGVFKLHKNIPEQLETIDFVDFIENQDGMYTYVDRFIVHKDFPGVSFHYTPQKIIAKTANGEHTILSEETIWNCYFSDVTGDGKADLCATVSKTKPFIARRVVVYDYAENRKYEFSDRDVNHYILSNENGFLTVNRYANADAYENEPASKGSLTIINGNLSLFVYAVNTLVTDKSRLTLDDVITLSVKGYDLTWEDFYEFKSIETGSGLYIRVYEIDETFSVWIGGGAPIGTPMYIYLSANDLDTRIDIRDGGVEEFIENAIPRYEIENIIYHSGAEDTALEAFYSDDKYTYYFPTIRSNAVIVYYKNGTEQSVTEALAEGKITMSDLDRYEIEYYADAKSETGESYVTPSSQKIIADLFAEIESSPSYSSNPKDYIDAHPDEYSKLIEYGNHTLVYVFNEFLAGGQTGLHGHILSSVMLDLLNENEIIKYDPTNGQDYFDQWLASAHSVQKQHDPVWLEVNVPSIALVLKMTGDISSETYVDQTEVDPDPVDTAISRALNQHYRDDEPTGLLHGISYVLLANETVSGTPRFGQTNHIEKEIYYLLVMHQKYSMQNGNPTAIEGSYIPTVLTFTKEDNGEYILDEYWEPRDGAYYDDDIKAKFPAGIIDEVWNMDAYSEKLEKQCADDVFVYVDNHQNYTEPGDF